jgi:hypothetical protein
VFLASITGALLRWLPLAVLALRRGRRLAPHRPAAPPVLFAKTHIYFCSSTWRKVIAFHEAMNRYKLNSFFQKTNE